MNNPSNEKRFMEAIWHIVLISFRKDTPQKTRDAIYDRYQTLAENCGGKKAGILFWRVDYNLDNRKNVHLVEIAVLKDEKALHAFRGHSEHKKFTDWLSKVADWQVGDLRHPFHYNK